MSLQPVDSETLLSAALRNSARKIETGGARVSCGKLPKVLADSRRLTFVFEELIENAIKFRGAAPVSVHIAAEARGGHWLFSVRDEGPGFDPRSAGLVFRMFRRLDPEGAPGSGVGLTICRQIIEQHQGEMWVDSEPGRGTIVFFTLPQ
jgi:signal transduction histidine kinase